MCTSSTVNQSAGPGTYAQKKKAGQAMFSRELAGKPWVSTDPWSYIKHSICIELGVVYETWIGQRKKLLCCFMFTCDVVFVAGDFWEGLEITPHAPTNGWLLAQKILFFFTVCILILQSVANEPVHPLLTELIVSKLGAAAHHSFHNFRPCQFIFT